MENVDINAIVIGIFLAMLVLAGSVMAGAHFFSEKRQVTKARLNKFQARYAHVSNKKGLTKSVFASTANVTTLEQTLRRLLPRRDEIRKRLARTGRRLTLVHYSAMILISAGATFLILSLIVKAVGVLPIIAAIAVGLGLPHLIIGSMIKKRIKSFITLFPDALDLIVRGLRSGLPLSESISIVANEIDDPVGSEFRIVKDQIKLGKTVDDALWQTSDRIDNAEFKFFVISLAIQKETGGNLAETLAKLSDLLRRRQQMKLKIKAMASEGKASAYIVGALPFVMFIALTVLNYDYASVLFTDPRGIMAALVGLAWMAIGVFIMSRMISFEI